MAGAADAIGALTIERDDHISGLVEALSVGVGEAPAIAENSAFVTARGGPVAGSVDGADEGRSARRAMLEQLRRECGSEEEFDTARTRPIWTEVDTCSSSSSADGPSAAELERIRVENREYFQRLVAENAPKWLTAERARKLRESLSIDVFESPFFWDFEGRLEAGMRLGGGGQAEIYEALYDGRVTEYVLKVFRSDSSLADLQRVWVCEAGRARRFDSAGTSMTLSVSGCCVLNGTLLKDGRFAFVMRRYWGDLRKLIDLQIVKDVATHQNPPFPLSITVWMVGAIASGMCFLHRNGILHRDLKAANVLLDNKFVDYCREGEVIISGSAFGSVAVADFDTSEGVMGTAFWRAPEVLHALKSKVKNVHLDASQSKLGSGSLGIADFETSEGVLGTAFWRSPEILHALKSKVKNVHLDASQSKAAFKCVGIADFETSEGIMGTAFWRAPEILHALKNKVRNVHLDASIWTEKVDVYSYAMTCYEVLTGCIPFQSRAVNDYDGIIGGERPLLPDYVDPEIQELVRRCWHSEPSMRPTFDEIEKDTFMILEKRVEVSRSIPEDERDAEARRWLDVGKYWNLYGLVMAGCSSPTRLKLSRE